MTEAPWLRHCGHGACSAPGLALYVSVATGVQGSLWTLDLQNPNPDGVAPGPLALESLHTTRAVLERAGAVVGKLRHDLPARPRLQCLGTHRFGRRAQPPALDGHSIGLGVLLAQASLQLGIGLPVTTVALAQVNRDGSLGTVDLLPQKLAVLDKLAQGVQRVLVHDQQLELVQDSIDEQMLELEAVGVSSVGDALEQVFEPQAFVTALRTTPAGERSARVLGAFIACLRGRGALFHWDAQARGADSMLQDPSWTLSELDCARLAVVRMVAGRYSRQRLPAPTPAQVNRLRDGPRDVVLAHLVQQAVSFGDDAIHAALLTQAQGRAEDPRTSGQLKLCGALARWVEAQDEGQACERHRQVVEGFMDLLQLEDCSLSLCEWIRLAAALNRRQELRDAMRIRDVLDATGTNTDVNRMYQTLVLGRAFWATGDVDQAMGLLQQAATAFAHLPNEDRVASQASRFLAICGAPVDVGRLFPVDRAYLSLWRSQDTPADHRAFLDATHGRLNTDRATQLLERGGAGELLRFMP